MKKMYLNIQRFATDEVEVEFKVAAGNMSSAFREATSSLNKFKGGLRQTRQEVNNLSKSASGLKSAFSNINLSGLFNQVKRIGKSLYSNFLEKAVDTSEELNLFNVVFDNIGKNGEETFSELGKKATEFQNKLNEAFGTNIKDTMRYQGLFQSMGESAGIDENAAALMSETMTKLSYDLASLFNTTETRAAESLRAGVYAGQTKPLRNYGIDVTQTSFKPILEELNIDKSVSELSQAEKEILRYEATLRQAQNAMGDFANTIDSPANQLKVLRQQFYEMQAAIGTLFVGAFARILPYVNAIIMVIKTLARTIAGFFGIKMKDYNSGIAKYADDLDDYSESLDGVGGSAGNAGKAIKELKRQTLAFDQINNITSPTPSSGGGGGGGGGALDGIDQRLLDLLRGYNNGMDDIRMKAVQIRDAILDWAKVLKPLEKPLKELAGLTYDGLIYVWNNVLKPLGSWVAWQLIPQVAKTVAAYLEVVYQVGKKLFSIYKTLYETIVQPFARVMGGTIISILKDIEKMLNFVASNKILTNILAIYTAFKQLKGILTLISGIKIKEIVTASGTKSVMTLGRYLSDTKDLLLTNVKSIKDWKTVWTNFLTLVTPAQIKLTAEMTKTQKAMATTKNVMSALKTAAAGLIAAFAGFKVLTSSFDDIKKNGPTIGNVLAAIAGSLVMVGGAIVTVNAILPIFGKTIQAIGTSLLTCPIFLVASAIAAIGVAIIGVNSATNEYNQTLNQGTQIADKNLKKLYELRDEADKQVKTTMAQIERGQDYKAILLDTLDANGKIREGEEDRANYALVNMNNQLGTTYKIEDGLIKTEDGLVKTREDLNAEIDNTIAKLKAEAYIEAFKDEYIQALKARRDGYIAMNAKIDESNKQLDMLKEQVKSGDITAQTAAEHAIFWEQQKIGANEDYQKALAQTDESVRNYEDLQAAYKKGSIEEMKKAMEQYGYKTDEVNKSNEKSAKRTTKEIKDDFIRQFTDIANEGKTKVNSIPTQKTVKIRADFSELDEAIRTVGAKKISSIVAKIGGKKDGGVYANGSWKPIQAYANGGMPSGGQLFMAREAGPELVGKIGRHTAVMNNNQIVDSVKAGVYEAVSAAMSESSMGAVEFVAHTDEGVVIDRINRITRQTGSCPIDI